MISRWFAPLAFLAVGACLLQGDSEPAGATHGSTPGVVHFTSIDVDPSATPANAPLSLGSREACRSVPFGGMFTVDVTVDEIDPYDRFFAFSTAIRYNRNVLSLVGNDPIEMIGVNPGSSVLNASDSVPDSDGNYSLVAVDTGPYPSTSEYGTGVLARLTFQAMGSGGSQIAPNDAAIVNGYGTSVYVSTPQSGTIGINHPDPCSDSDGDGLLNAADNCAAVEASDPDYDTLSDSCDIDDDGDGSGDMAETPCGANPTNPAIRPERTDLPGNDDGDSETNEPLPPGASAFDCDGDGFTGAAEDNVFGGAARGDQDPCGTAAWPADFVSGGIPDSTNRVTITDATSFIAPVRHLNTSPGAPPDPGYDIRWDLQPGPGVFAKHINISDLTAALIVAPAMLNGARALSGPQCPWP